MKEHLVYYATGILRLIVIVFISRLLLTVFRIGIMRKYVGARGSTARRTTMVYDDGDLAKKKRITYGTRYLIYGVYICSFFFPEQNTTIIGVLSKPCYYIVFPLRRKTPVFVHYIIYVILYTYPSSMCIGRIWRHCGVAVNLPPDWTARRATVW